MVVPSPQVTLDDVAERLIGTLGNSVTRAMYGKAIRDFISWCRDHSAYDLTRSLLETYRTHLSDSKYSASTVNQRLSAIRKLVLNSGDDGLLPVAQSSVPAQI